MAVERTINPYATYGPDGEGGRSWAEYFRAIRALRDGGKQFEYDSADINDGDESGDYSIDQHGELDQLPVVPPRAAGTLVKQLEKRGFTIKTHWWKTLIKGKIAKSGKNEGELNPDREIISLMVGAYRLDKGYVKFIYELPTHLETPKWTCTWRQIDGKYVPVSDAQLKEWING